MTLYEQQQKQREWQRQAEEDQRLWREGYESHAERRHREMIRENNIAGVVGTAIGVGIGLLLFFLIFGLWLAG